jgi:hypothetical protein
MPASRGDQGSKKVVLRSHDPAFALGNLHPLRPRARVVAAVAALSRAFASRGSSVLRAPETSVPPYFDRRASNVASLAPCLRHRSGAVTAAGCSFSSR